MSKTLVTEIVIAAPAKAVWEALTDFARYGEWNPFIVEAAGEARVGSRLTLRMQPVGGRAMTLRPTVIEAVAGEKLRWRGRLGVRGLFDAEHSFLLEERSAGGTRLVQTRGLQRCARPAVPSFPRPPHAAGLPSDERGARAAGDAGAVAQQRD